MATLFSIVIILASIFLIIVVFVQNPKGGGLSSDLGSAHQLGGVKKTNDFVEKATWTLAGTIMVVSIVLTIMTKPAEPKIQEQPETQQSGGGQGQGQNSNGQGQSKGN